jgi:hypothetical protein
MAGTLKVLRIVQSALLAGILLSIAGAEIAAPKPRPVNPTFSYIFSTMAVAIVGMIFVVRRTLVSRSAEILSTRPEEALMLNHWKTGCIATYALCEGLALFGLVLRFLGYNLEQSLPFYLGGFALLAFFRPRVPRGPAHTPSAGI